MGYDEILTEIKNGLKGNPDHDIPYLREQMDRYKDHELSTEIIRACGRIMYEVLPSEAKDEIANLIKKDELDANSVLDEVRFNIYKGNHVHALELMESLVSRLEEIPMYQDDSVSAYYTFDEFMEEILHSTLSNEERDIRRAQQPYSIAYLQYGSVLFELGKFEAANEALKKALRWNPSSIGIRSEYMETLKQLGKFDEFFQFTIDSFNYAFKSKDVARCYRNLGFYFVEELKYKEAKACYILSLQYEPQSKNASSELYYIDQKTNGQIPNPTPDDMREYSEKYGFPVGAATHVLQIAYSLGQKCLKEGQKDGAIYFYTILFDLTDDAEFRKILDNLKA